MSFSVLWVWALRRSQGRGLEEVACSTQRTHFVEMEPVVERRVSAPFDDSLLALVVAAVEEGVAIP